MHRVKQKIKKKKKYGGGEKKTLRNIAWKIQIPMQALWNDEKSQGTCINC